MPPTWCRTCFAAGCPGAFDLYILAAIPVSFLAAAAVGAVLERGVIRWLYGRPLETLLATWGISLILMQAVRNLFGAQNVPVENPAWLSGGVAVMSNLTLPYNRIAIIVFAMLVLAGVAALIAHTRLGLFVRGVTQNRKMAACMGVNTARIDTYAFALGSGIAGLAGCALSQVGNVGPDLGQSYIVDCVHGGGAGRCRPARGHRLRRAGPGRAEQAARRLAGRGAGQDHGAGVHRHLHPEAAAGHLRDEGPECGSVSRTAIERSPTWRRAPVQRAVAMPPRGFLSARSWSGVFVALLVVAVLVPTLNLVIPAGSVFHMSDYAVQLVGKIMCYAICALAMDLIWGYTGILSLGHGLFFALGGYMMGMYLMRQIGSDGQYRMPMPDFMVFLNWKEFPWHWAVSDSFIAQMLLVVLVPGLVAFVFGYFAFRSRIKGVYFSIITQALTYAAMLLFFRNETGFGGNNGFTDFKRILDQPIATPGMRMTLFVITGLTLIGCFVFARWLVNTKYGRVLQAIRDAESRVMFTGYNPVAYKLSIWTLSAVMCGIAGALYVPQVGIINPSEMSPAASIEIAIWAAVGGRGTLIGPIVGAFFVNGAKSWFTQAFPEIWLYFLGALFIAVTLFLPQGIVGLVRKLTGKGNGEQA